MSIFASLPRARAARESRRGLLGAAVVVVLFTMWVEPSARALDILWSGTSSNNIGGANLDGTGVNENFITGANMPFGIAVEGNYIYWANGGSIARANLNGTGVNLNFITGGADTVGVA